MEKQPALASDGDMTRPSEGRRSRFESGWRHHAYIAQVEEHFLGTKEVKGSTPFVGSMPLSGDPDPS